MKTKLPDFMEAHRVRKGWAGSRASDGLNGAFVLKGPGQAYLRIIASDGIDPWAQGWEHVSVSCSSIHRCPNWNEMCFVKDIFWDKEETVIQFHPPKSEYVNHHPNTLHLWRKRDGMIETPPSFLVGPR